ncbi:hypothetical protein F4810DRAFT_685268 [Camillea tinctor]|nr:hypothetical protein F4810DRAFT_685268 [Camillea tinctor]
MSSYRHTESRMYRTGEHYPNSQFNYTPRRAPGGRFQSHEQLQPQGPNMPSADRDYMSARQNQYLPIRKQEPPEGENNTRIWRGAAPEPSPPGRPAIAPTRRLLSPAAIAHTRSVIEQPDGNPSYATDASHENYGLNGVVDRREPTTYGYDTSDKALSLSEGYWSAGHDEYHYQENHNIDSQNRNPVNETEAEEQENYLGGGYYNVEDDSNASEDSNYRDADQASPCEPYGFFFSWNPSGPSQPPAETTTPHGLPPTRTPTPQGSPDQLNSRSGSYSDSDLAEVEEVEDIDREDDDGREDDGNQEDQDYINRLRELTAFTREAFTDIQRRPTIVVAGDWHNNYPDSVSSPPSLGMGAPIILVAGDMYTGPEGSSSSRSSRQKRKNDTAREEVKKRKQLKH